MKRERPHGSSGRHQRLRPHRPQYAARHRRSRPQGHRGRRASTISARSRPMRTCCATTPCTAASRRGQGRRRHHRRPGRRDQGHRRSRIRRRCRTRSSASTSRWNAPASSPRKDKAAAHLDRRRQARHRLGAGRRRRPHGRLRRQPRQADQGPHRHLERLLHDQLPRAGRQGAARRLRHRARLHDDDPLLHRRPADARHRCTRTSTAPAPRRCR